MTAADDGGSMEILEITMKHFGRFTNQTMTFHPGVNIIYGENETGKSTMRAFIRAMLFGLEKQRGRAAETDEYALRTPWENGSYFAGVLRLKSGDKVYRIERNFEKKAREMRLICETDGRELGERELSGLLDGMDESAFANTVFFGGTSGQTDDGLVLAVRNGMINLNQSGSSRIDAAGALERLKEEKKRLEREKKQQMAQKIDRLQELSMKIDYVRQEAADLAGREEKFRQELRGMQDMDEAEPERDAEPEEEIPGAESAFIWRAGKAAMALIAVAALAAGLLMTRWQVRAGAAAVILLSCIGVRFFSVQNEKSRAARRERELEQREARMRMEFERRQARIGRQQREAPKRQRLAGNLEWASNACREKQAQLDDLQEEYEALRQSRDGTEEIEQQILAADLAIDTLERVTAEIYREHAAKLNADISDIFAKITGGRYTGVFLDEDFQVRVQTPQKLLSPWQVSRGTVEQLYFALRMACADFVNPGEKLPLILDDAFITYDDTRLKHTLQWLYFGGRQVLLFTCHRREQELIYSLSQENG